MKKSAFITILLAFIFFAQNSSAASWELDKAHSNFYFSVDHIFSKVNGLFEDYTGTIQFNPDKLDESKFVFKINVNSINTHNTKRDKHLLSADFFNESKFPVIQFESNNISKAGDRLYNVAGTLTIKGKEFNLTLPLSLAGIKDHPAKKGTKVAGFNGKITIDRLAYGVGSGKFFDYGVVGKEVEIFISLEVLGKG